MGGSTPIAFAEAPLKTNTKILLETKMKKDELRPWEIMKAHDEGAEIERRTRVAESDWSVTRSPDWNWVTTEFRVK